MKSSVVNRTMRRKEQGDLYKPTSRKRESDPEDSLRKDTEEGYRSYPLASSADPQQR